jgi:hypothetical protein
MKKRRLTFYGHIFRMDDNRLTKQIFNIINRYKCKPTWFQEIDKDMKILQISPEIINNKTLSRQVVHKAEFQENEKKATGRKWTQIQKDHHSRRMKEIWKQRKSKTKEA